MAYPAYCTATDVLNMLPPNSVGPFTTTSVPTLAQVTAWLGYRAGEIDSAIKHRGLTTPVTAPAEFVEELLSLNAQGVAAWVAAVAYPSTQIPGHSAAAESFEGMFQARLAEIRTGIGVPVGVAVFEADLSPRSFMTDTGAWGMPDGTVTDVFGDLIFAEPTFVMSKKW